jgi:hypothetical protein
MNMRVAEIIAKRDEISIAEAQEMVRECREAIMHSSIWEADDIIMDMLGLEPDYLFDILYC